MSKLSSLFKVIVFFFFFSFLFTSFKWISNTYNFRWQEFKFKKWSKSIFWRLSLVALHIDFESTPTSTHFPGLRSNGFRRRENKGWQHFHLISPTSLPIPFFQPPYILGFRIIKVVHLVPVVLFLEHDMNIFQIHL